MASTLLGGSAPAPLAIRPTAGGRQLYDPGTGAEYATDAAGFYVDSNGDRLTVDAGWGVGDEVGPEKVYGLTTAVVSASSPALGGGRRAGFRFGSAGTEYIGVTLPPTATQSFLAHIVTGVLTTSVKLAFGMENDPVVRWVVLIGGTSVQARVYDSGGTERGRATVPTPLANATEYYIGASFSDGDMAVYVWDAAGADVDEQSVSPPTGPYTLGGGAYYIGGRPSFTVPMDQADLLDAFGWATALKTKEQLASVVASLVAGSDVDEAATDADLPTDGIICGAIDNTDLTALAYIGAEGDGTPVVVAQP